MIFYIGSLNSLGVGPRDAMKKFLSFSSNQMDMPAENGTISTVLEKHSRGDAICSKQLKNNYVFCLKCETHLG